MNTQLTQTLAAACLLLLCSCATVFSDSSDTVRFDSSPPGADVYLNGQKIGRTPLSRTFIRDTFDKKTVQIIKPGYKEKVFTLQKKLNKVALVNFTFWPSWITDALSGNMIEYAPNSYQVFLEPHSKQSMKELNESDKKKLLFILSHYQPLLGDIAQGRGEYLENLWKLEQAPEMSYEDYLQKVRGHTTDLMRTQRGHELYSKLQRLLNNPRPEMKKGQ